MLSIWNNGRSKKRGDLVTQLFNVLFVCVFSQNILFVEKMGGNVLFCFGMDLKSLPLMALSNKI